MLDKRDKKWNHILEITSMIKKFFLCLLFFVLSPLVLGSVVYLTSFPPQKKVLGEKASLPQSKSYLVTLPEETGALAPTIKLEDSTPVIIENYLRYYRSPLLPYTETLLKAAEKYGVKPQLMVAIAQQESNLGKKSPPECHNAWGWGIHTKGTKCYDSWPQAIESVTAGVAADYCAKGYCEDACLMMKKYAPRSEGSWCAAINQFLKEMETGFF